MLTLTKQVNPKISDMGVKVRFYIPTKDRNGRELPADVQNVARQKVGGFLAELAGGFTGFPGVGGWITPAGELMTEDVFIVEATAPEGTVTLNNQQYAHMLRVGEWIWRYLNQGEVRIEVGSQVVSIT